MKQTGHFVRGGCLVHCGWQGAKRKQTSGPARKAPAGVVLKDIRRATKRQFAAEEKIRIVREGLRGEESIAELCRREGIASSMHDGWSKGFLEAGKARLAGDTARAPPASATVMPADARASTWPAPWRRSPQACAPSPSDPPSSAP